MGVIGNGFVSFLLTVINVVQLSVASTAKHEVRIILNHFLKGLCFSQKVIKLS